MSVEPSAAASPEEACSNLAALWRTSEHVVAFTGAGMSTESGLPDFRSAGGLWKQSRRFEELASLDGLRRMPEEFREFYRWRMTNLMQHAPHRGHLVLAEFEAQGKLSAVITQNVDGFHEAAGSKNVLRLHGSLRTVRCQNCGSGSEMESFLTEKGHECARCAGAMRPNVVLFGESLDSDVLDAAAKESRRCDLFVVLGSSLQVSPANALPALALKAGARVVIVNQEPTPFDDRADLVIHERIGQVLDHVSHALSDA